MLSLPPSGKVYLALDPVDMRKGVDALANVVRSTLGQVPTSGHLFVFRGRRGHMLRILFWDRNGWALDTKRLERGQFYLATTEVPPGTEHLEVESADLSLSLEGIDPRGARRQRRWRPAADLRVPLTDVGSAVGEKPAILGCGRRAPHR